MAKCKYDPETFPILVLGWARKGITEKQMAKNLGVSKPTFENYKKKYPNFLNSLQRGKKPLINELENALYKAGKGFTGPDDKYYPPSVAALRLALINLSPKDWRDKQTQEVTGPDEGPITVKVLRGASMDEL